VMERQFLGFLGAPGQKKKKRVCIRESHRHRGGDTLTTKTGKRDRGTPGESALERRVPKVCLGPREREVRLVADIRLKLEERVENHRGDLKKVFA